MIVADNGQTDSGTRLNAFQEADMVRERYDRRARSGSSVLYDPLNPSVYMGVQERERALIRCLKAAGLHPVSDKRVLEIGCGAGANLIQLIRLGFMPELLTGNELLVERAATARSVLPEATSIVQGDAVELDLPENSFDIVLQSTVFTSILDNTFQERLAGRMWSLAKPGGGVLWYDFVYDNPRNPDVRGVPLRRVRELFPQGEMTAWRLTLAPPISRLVTRLHPSLYTVFNALPFLRTHVLCWIKKREHQDTSP